MKNMPVLGILLICIIVLLTGIARADDFAPPPWVRGVPLSTAMEWEFLTDANGHTGPDGNTVATVPGSLGSGTVSIYGNSPGVTPIWSIGDGDGQWSAPINDPIAMEFQIENWIDNEPVKYLRIQVTYGGTPPSVTGLWAHHASENPVLIVPTGTTAFSTTHLLFEYELYPNPDFELFHLDIPPGASIDQVVVDTISIPEPATLGVLAVGGLIALRRRRRTS